MDTLEKGNQLLDPCINRLITAAYRAIQHSTTNPYIGTNNSQTSMQKILIVLGLLLVALGVLWPLLTKVGLGRLPGDIVIERDGFRFYFPLATSLLVSAVLTLILWLFNR